MSRENILYKIHPVAFRSLNLSVHASSKRKSTPKGVLFFLLLVYTLDITFQPLKTYHWASKSQIFRSQVFDNTH